MRKPQQFEDWPTSIDPGFGPFRAVMSPGEDSRRVRGVGRPPGRRAL